MTTEKKVNKSNPETALAEFERWADGMMLDMDTSNMDAEDLTAFKKVQRRLLNCLVNGAMVLNADGLFEYTAQNPKSSHKEPLVFHEVTGAALMEMDGKTKNQDVRKMYAAIASTCKVHVKAISGMVGIDAKVVREVFLLLMD